jgi:DNA repair protein RecN (Recombination protein N)
VSEAREACEALKAKASSRESQLVQLEQILEDLDKLAPGEGEASRLAMERAILINSQKLIECLSEADEAVRGSDAAHAFSLAARHLDRACRLPELAEAEEDNPHLSALKTAQEAIERALIEIDEASIAVETARSAFYHDPDALEQVEQRLFSLRAAGRKFSVDPDSLCELQADARIRLGQLIEFDDAVIAAEADVKAREDAYLDVAGKLSALRKSSGEKLAKSVLTELKPLKLEHAKFRVRVEQMDVSRAGPNGVDDILFEVQTNPGSPFGALNQIASGGELARFTLALRVCLASIQSASLLIFDEADQGVGGAVAAAVGERLGRLAEERQVMAITHSPQVAASGHHHWHISKKVSKDRVTSSKMTVLERQARLEEVARMLSGSEITNEARAAAERLMAERV